jgi:predicted TIM-barrel fold metal-dependent hydrolase
MPVVDVAGAAGLPHLRPEFTDRQLEERAALWTQLLFGSDFPSIPHDLAAQVRGLAVLGLDELAWRSVLHDAAADLLELR